MQKLIEGIHHFQTNIFPTQREWFENLARRQQPEVLFITCSDSRIDPNLLTNTRPGELFILRNAGHIVPPHDAPCSGSSASIEFAVVALGVREIVVCGHSHCGAVNGVLHPETLKDMPSVADWLTHAERTRRIVQDNYGSMSPEQMLTAAIEENVLVQLENICTLPCVARRLTRGGLTLHGWVYQIETGKVFAYDPQSEQFLPLEQSYSRPAKPGAEPKAGHVI
jgi:carbonic anhydrase